MGVKDGLWLLLRIGHANRISWTRDFIPPRFPPRKYLWMPATFSQLVITSRLTFIPSGCGVRGGERAWGLEIFLVVSIYKTRLTCWCLAERALFGRSRSGALGLGRRIIFPLFYLVGITPVMQITLKSALNILEDVVVWTFLLKRLCHWSPVHFFAIITFIYPLWKLTLVIKSQLLDKKNVSLVLHFYLYKKTEINSEKPFGWTVFKNPNYSPFNLLQFYQSVPPFHFLCVLLNCRIWLNILTQLL